MSSTKLLSLLFVELFVVSLLLLSLFTIGHLKNNSTLLINLGLYSYFFWHIYHLIQLLFWLNSDQSSYLHSSFGVWKHIFKHLHQQCLLNQSKQNKLSQNLENYRTFVDRIPDAVIIIKNNNSKQKNEIEWFNKTAQSLFNLTKEKHIGSSLNTVFTDKTMYKFMFNQKQHETLEIVSPMDQNKILSLRLIPYQKSSRLLFLRDISHVYWTDKMRKDFIANVSHELRTPLTIISGYLENFESHIKNNDIFLEPIQSMQRQSIRMGNLIQDLLVLSRLESNSGSIRKKQLIPVPAMIKSIINDTKTLDLKHNHTIISDIDYTLMLSGYESEIQSLISNLINNAILYTPSGSTIKVYWYKKNHKVYFSVSDNGNGIKEKHLKRLTERFYRVDKGRSRSSGGTGLGLSIVKHIANHHNAELTIESKWGKGSRFTCCFKG